VLSVARSHVRTRPLRRRNRTRTAHPTPRTPRGMLPQGRFAGKSPAHQVSEKCRRWWLGRARSFLLPPLYAGHAHAWERIDADTVGCALCGVVHECGAARNIVACVTEQQPDSSTVCTLTGIVLSTCALFDVNIASTAFNNSRGVGSGGGGGGGGGASFGRRGPARADEVEYMWRVCMDAATLLLVSDKAQAARDLEQQSYARKVSLAFARHVKRSRNMFETVSMVDALQYAIYTVRQTRAPPPVTAAPPMRHLYAAMREMVELVMLLALPKPYDFKINNEKIANFVISLFYIAVDGIVVDGHVFLSPCEGLRGALPMQLLLWPVFGLQPKLITEGENVAKMCIKNLTPAEISQHRSVIARHHTPPCPFVDHVDQCTCPESEF